MIRVPSIFGLKDVAPGARTAGQVLSLGEDLAVRNQSLAAAGIEAAGAAAAMGLAQASGAVRRIAAADSSAPNRVLAKVSCAGADDDQVIQAEIDELAAAGGGTIFLMPGLYHLSRSIILRSGVSLIGVQPRVAAVDHYSIDLGFTLVGYGEQVVALRGVTGGTWTVTVNGHTTSAMAWNISGYNLQVRLNALPGVTCTVRYEGPYLIRGITDEIEIDDSSLTGTNTDVSTAVGSGTVLTFPGPRTQTATIYGSPSGGTFTLSYGGETSAPLAFNANRAAVQAALRALTGLGDVTVTAGAAGRTYQIDGLPVAATAVTGDGSLLTGGSADLDVGAAEGLDTTAWQPYVHVADGGICLAQELIDGYIGTDTVLSAAHVRQLGFRTCASVLYTGGPNQSGMSYCTVEELMMSNITGMAFQFDNYHHLTWNHLNGWDVYKCLSHRQWTDVNPAHTPDYSPNQYGNSTFRDCTFYISAAGCAALGGSMEYHCCATNGGTQFSWGLITFNFVCIVRFMTEINTPHSYNLDIGGFGSPGVISGIFDGLDIEGAADAGINLHWVDGIQLRPMAANAGPNYNIRSRRSSNFTVWADGAQKLDYDVPGRSSNFYGKVQSFANGNKPTGLYSLDTGGDGAVHLWWYMGGMANSADHVGTHTWPNSGWGFYEAYGGYFAGTKQLLLQDAAAVITKQVNNSPILRGVTANGLAAPEILRFGDNDHIWLGYGGTATDVYGDLRMVGKVGFYDTAPVAKPTVTGSRGGNAALASLLTALASQGLITDGSSA